MAFISQNEINTIRSNASIVDIISSYIPLTQKGKNYFGVCPFHEDHSPSMSVSPEKQIYKCFSCGATGNVFTFVENYLNVSFAEAVIQVARTVGISIQSDLLPQREIKYKKEYELMELVMKFYQNNLNTKNGQAAIQYLAERDLNEDTIKEFDIGLSLDRNQLYSLLNKKGYQDKLLSDLGLISISEQRQYDVFQNRIMFPIHNLEGYVVGFTARCYVEQINPKYLNTRDTYIFKKGSILFNYHRAKDAIRLHKKVIVVEGNMDAIRLSSVGIKNVIALMGTSLTKDQIEALKKLRAKIILMLDNDNAGEVATYAVGNQLEENNLDIEIIRLSGAKDPDEYIIQNGVEAMQEIIQNPISFIDFKLNYLKKNKNLNDSADLANYIKEVLNHLEKNNDPILREVTLQKLSSDYNISYAVLKEQLKEETTKVEMHVDLPKINVPNKTGYKKVAQDILYYMMNDPLYVKLYQTQLGIFPTKEERQIANEIVYYCETNRTINLADFITYAETTNFKQPIMDIISESKNLELSEASMFELLMNIKRKIKDQEIKKLKEEIKKELDINRKTELLEKIAEIKKGSVENEGY